MKIVFFLLYLSTAQESQVLVARLNEMGRDTGKRKLGWEEPGSSGMVANSAKY